MVFTLGSNLNLAVLILFSLWLVFLTVIVLQTSRHYNSLIKNNQGQTLTEILEKILADHKLLEKINQDAVSHFQKSGLVRFNPFEEVGGDQSFTLALLDGENNGLVLTSLTSRTGTRWYTKIIKKGEGAETELSKEEKQAIEQAQEKQYAKK